MSERITGKKEALLSTALIGGSGFIGSRLADRLDKQGIPIGIHDIRESLTGRRTFFTDVTNPEALRTNLAGYDAVVNLAAEHRDDVRPISRYDAVNVEGARNVCQVARQHGIQRIVFTSSVAVYGIAPPDTDETGEILPFNDYGRTKAQAESIYRQWQKEDHRNRHLVIVRPTVVFGEGNRGNVYNLLRQIQSGWFIMVGSGRNRKSMAYVENVAAFLEESLKFGPGIHIYNYADKKDYDMNGLSSVVKSLMGKKCGSQLRIPFWLGYIMGLGFDGVSRITGRTLPVSSVRVKKFCSESSFGTSVRETGFVPPVPLEEALQRSVRYEFLEDNHGPVFYTE